MLYDVMDDDEEEVFVLVELSGLPDQDLLQHCKGRCSILGLGSREPVLKLDQYVFRGKHEDTLGTCLVFKEGKGRRRRLEHLCTASQKLTMNRVLPKKKEKPSTAAAAAVQQ